MAHCELIFRYGAEHTLFLTVILSQVLLLPYLIAVPDGMVCLSCVDLLSPSELWKIFAGTQCIVLGCRPVLAFLSPFFGEGIGMDVEE